MAKMMKKLTYDLVRLKLVAKPPNRHVQEGSNRNPNQFRRLENVPQIMQRERRNKDDQRVLPPFQNNAVEETKGVVGTEDDSTIHLHDIDLPSPHLTQQ
jgi:hypothetical protein